MQSFDEELEHLHENHKRGSTGQRLNWLRAGVLGANDGIVSVAGVVVGVAAATPGNLMAIATAGVAALVAGAFSMAGGEYVSVSTQRDTEKAILSQQKRDLKKHPLAELAALTGLYRKRGLSADLAHQVAVELTEHDALSAHAEVSYGIDPDDLTNPWAAALSSFLAFTIGGVLPIIMIVLPFGEPIFLTAAAVVLGLFLTGFVSAKLGGAPIWPAILRNVFMGVLTMLATYFVGMLFGVAIN